MENRLIKTAVLGATLLVSVGLAGCSPSKEKVFVNEINSLMKELQDDAAAIYPDFDFETGFSSEAGNEFGILLEELQGGEREDITKFCAETKVMESQLDAYLPLLPLAMAFSTEEEQQEMEKMMPLFPSIQGFLDDISVSCNNYRSK